MSLKYELKLDPKFQPMIVELRDFKNEVAKSTKKVHVAFCVERNNGYRYRYDIDVIPNNVNNTKMIEKLLKSIIWVVGGYKIYISGPTELTSEIKKIFSVEGARRFDVEFMTRVYRNQFEVVVVDEKEVPSSKEASISVGGNLDGCRIGFDAGGSDRKVSAVIDGEVVFSEEVVWFPKTNSDPDYHYQGILDSFKTAASKMPRVDAIGVSSAGIYIDNEVRVASLFVKVPQDVFDEKARDIYIRAAKEIGDVPLEVVNDGDVTALAGALSLQDNKILGIAMGTSEAVGYINENGDINGWLSELAFVPVDYNEDSMVDEWSGDYGCGVKYFSQDGIIKLAKPAGIELDESLSPAEKLKVVQKLMAEDDPRAKEIYETIGVYLGYTLPYYAEFYNIKYLLLLGRVTSGKGGDLLIEKAKEVIKNVFPEYASIIITTPDEKTRRVGQSIAAASLPATK